MKNIFLSIIIILSLDSCAVELPGYQFSNFENTPSWELAKAIRNNDALEVRKILNTKTINVNFKDPEYQQTLLSLAIVNLKPNTIVELLKAGANPNELVGDSKDRTPFIDAIEYSENCDIFYVQTLLEYGAKPNLEIESDGILNAGYPLLAAINLNDNEGNECLNILKLLVAQGADINCCHKKGYSEICEGVITKSLRSRSMETLKYFVIEKNISIPDTVYIIGGVDKETQKVYGLAEILKSEHFSFKDFDNELGSFTFPEARKIRDEIILYLEQRKR